MSSTIEAQESVRERNAAFWDELCGTHFAKTLGVTDSSPASLKTFDDWCFAFYAFLFAHIPFEDMKGKRVPEIGRGYGTVSRRIAEAGADCQGLDIAAGPVGMVDHRLQHKQVSKIHVCGTAVFLLCRTRIRQVLLCNQNGSTIVSNGI